MMRTFSISLFRFDAAIDYLPYYAKYSLKLDCSASLKDLLNSIKSKDVLVNLSDDGVCVNGYATALDVSLERIYERLGDELLIEPLDKKRATKDLIINKDDFLERFDLLAPYVEHSDRDFFQTLILIHYASYALRFDPEIYGSAFYYFCAKMVKKYPQFEKEIIEIVSDLDAGIGYHLPLEFKLFDPPKDLEPEIEQLKKRVKEYFPDRIKEPLDSAKNPITKPLESFLGCAKDEVSATLKEDLIKHKFDGFKAGIYLGKTPKISSLMQKIIDISALKVYMLKSTHNPDGESLIEYNSKMAYKMAGEILLEALDNGCDFLLVDDPAHLAMFDKKQKAIQKAVGRAIGIPVISVEQLVFIALGEIEASQVLTHEIKPQFLPQ